MIIQYKGTAGNTILLAAIAGGIFRWFPLFFKLGSEQGKSILPKRQEDRREKDL
jgi:hypothetical protein